MSITYHYANLTKQEWFSASAFGGSGDRDGLGLNLTARAFELLLVTRSQQPDGQVRIEVGRWAGDSIAIVGDADEEWLEYQRRFADLYADLIPFINRRDGFSGLADAAAQDDRLYTQICHLIMSRQAAELEVGMKERFGSNFRQRYKDVIPKLQRFEQPRDLQLRAADDLTPRETGSAEWFWWMKKTGQHA